MNGVHCDSTVRENIASKMGRIVVTSTGLPLALCLITMAIPLVDCCRTINRAAEETAHTAEVARREAAHLGQVLRESIENLRSDMATALEDIDQQVGQVGRYVTQELGPTIEDTMTKLNENSEDVVDMIESSLNNLNTAIDKTVSKTSMLFDLLIVLVLLVIGAFCRKNLNEDMFLKPVFWLFQVSSFFTAVALAVHVIFCILTGHEPANYQHFMLNAAVVILPFLIIVHVSPALFSILCNFCTERVTAVDVPTLMPLSWPRRFTGCSYKWLLTYTLLSPFLMAAVWLASGNVTATLLLTRVFLPVALATKVSLVYALLFYMYVPLLFLSRMVQHSS